MTEDAPQPEPSPVSGARPHAHHSPLIEAHPHWLAPTGRLVLVLAAALSLFQVWQPIVGFIPPGVVPFEPVLGLQPATYFRPTHLGWILTLGFLVYPSSPSTSSSTLRRRAARALDLLGVVLVLWSTSRVLSFDYQSIDHLLHGLRAPDLVAGCIVLVATLEIARRSVGIVMMLVGLTFIVYAAFGNLLPDVLATRGFSFERIVRFQVFTQAGLYGAPIGIAAGAVFSFVLFGALLQATGAGSFLIDLSFAAAGRYRGGPAKASVLASAAMGSISGSAIANTVTTGALTIPMMKQLGYRPAQAAGIEAAASTGGQIMPPIMGAGAFVMAEFTRTAYGDIVWMSLVPAVLYFTSVLLYVHLMAAKAGFRGMQDATRARDVMRRGAHFLLPLVLITALLLRSYSPVLVGVSGCAAVVVASWLRAHTRIRLERIGRALAQGAVLAVPISVACAVAGIVVGTIGQTGIGLQFTESVVALSGGHLWLALALVGLAALVLGMGLPATAAYIVLAVMTGPALQELGLALVTAHMIIFWLAQTSNVTPPIALAAFAGAGIAGAPPMRSAVEAFRLANGLFVIPLMMAYTPLLLGGGNGWGDVLLAAGLTLTVVVVLAGISERFLFGRVGPVWMAIGLGAVGLLLHPSSIARSAGVLASLALVGVNYLSARRKP
jgi:TRAP transporter 4TM/12TM fusion protein